MHEAYRPVTMVAALWPTQDFQFPCDVEALGARLAGQFGLFTEQRLNGTVPPPGALQHEWPRLILMGEQRRWGLELAPGKISLRQALGVAAPVEDLFEQHRAVLAPLMAWLSENLDFRPYRMGLVLQIFCNTKSSANEKIAQYFLQPRALQEQTPYEVNLSLLSKVLLSNGTHANRWLRVRPLRSIDPRRVDFAAQIEVDVNTLPEDTQVRTARDLADFYAAVSHHIEEEIPFLCDGEFVE